MTNRTRTGIVLLVLAQALAGCGGSDSSSAPLAPSVVPQLAPSPAPQPTPIQLAVFTDPASGFSTSDVRDVQEQVVRVNTANELIWTADATHFSGYRVNGNQIRGPGRDDWFQVRFGTKNGEQRAYLGWSDDWCHCPGYPATIADIEVVNGQLVITATERLAPGS
jgi:hypothetical protein